MRHLRLLLPFIAVLSLLAGACGGGDDDSAGGETATDATGATGATDATGGAGGGECAATELVFTNLETGEEVAATSAAAVSLEGGAAYTAYVADFALDAAELSLFSAPEVPDDGNLVTLAVTIFNATEPAEALEAGQRVEYTDEFGVLTFRVTHQAGETYYGTNNGASGTVTLTDVGDTFCAEVDYADEQKTLAGTLAAPVKAL